MNIRTAFEEAIVNMTSNPMYAGEYIFYHGIISHCTLVFDNKLPAPAGVSTHYNKINLYINPDIFNKFSLLQRMTILKHEAQHIIHRHSFRATKEHNDNHTIWNVATDCAINQQCNDDVIKELNGIRYQDLKLPRDKDSETYFELLKEDLDKSKESQCSGNSGTSIELENLKGYDSHSTWENSEGDENLLKEFTKNIIEKAVNSTLKAKGNIPGYVHEVLSLLSKKKEIKWESVLKNIVGNKKTSSRETIIRRNRRFPERYDLNGKIRDRKFNVVSVVDVSGSVSDNELLDALGEINHICKMTGTDLDIIQVDSEAREPEKFKQNMKMFTRTGYGGTDLRYAIPSFNEYNLNPNCVIICTDGGICDNDIDAYYDLTKKGIKIIWLVTSDGYLSDKMTSDDRRMRAFKLKSKNTKLL